MRVLLLSWDYPPRSSGGVAAHVAGLAGALNAGGHDVVVLTVGSARTRPPADRERVVRAVVDLPYLSTTDVVARTAAGNHALVRAATGVTTDDGAAWQPDIVHAHDWRVGWAADTIARQAGVPFLLSLHGIERMRHGGRLPRGTATDVDSIEWWLAFEADHVIASTQLMVDQLMSAFELSPDRISTIPYGIDAALWAPEGPRASAPIEREPLVMSWGSVQYQKGFQVLVRAMRQLRGTHPDLRAVIAGRGRYLPELQTQIDVDGVSNIIELPGYLDDRRLRSLVHRSACVVVPSLYEPFGIVALEALAAGAPLIVAHTGGLAELVDGTDAGISFEPGNPDDLARQIAAVLESPALATALRTAAAKLIAERHAWPDVAAATSALYHRVIGNVIGGTD
ncbi:MAG: glycosyltransferase family 4 protein [Actinomycetota bacterium]